MKTWLPQALRTLSWLSLLVFPGTVLAHGEHQHTLWERFVIAVDGIPYRSYWLPFIIIVIIGFSLRMVLERRDKSEE